MLDLSKYKSSLLEFLQLVESLNQPKWLVAEHLRIPDFNHSTLVGSTFGRDAWEEPAAKNLIATLLEDEDLGRWFTPPPDSALNELRSQVASLVAAWESRNATPQQIVADFADPFLQAVRNIKPVCSAVRILYGIEVAERVEFASGLAIEPASPDTLTQVLTRFGASAREALRIPRRPAVLVWTTGQVSREDFASFAATTANGWADVLAENARLEIWLTTGQLPTLGDKYTFEQSDFPVTPSERFPASQRETHARPLDRDPGSLDTSMLYQIHLRMSALQAPPENFPEEVILPLWVANTFIHPAVDATDPLMSLLLAYAAAEGLILREKEDKSLFWRRLAPFIEEDIGEIRRLRRITQRWVELRGYAAHGQRPPLKVLAAFLEQQISQDDWASSRAGDPIVWQEVQKRAERLLRRVFLAMLFFCVALDGDDSPRAQFTRDEVIAILERAASGDQGARREIIETVPQFVRDIGL